MEVKSIYPIINFSDEDEIAVQYERLGADGVIIISPDFSDEAMLIKKIRNICEKSDCRLYIWQPYRRLEDIKKVLYAGAAGAWIEATEQTLIREAADRFGDGKLYMSYSGDSVSDYYCLGWLIADEDAELLDPASWERTGYPVLAREHVAAERGPGHNSFTKDEYGRDVIIYHA